MCALEAHTGFTTETGIAESLFWLDLVDSRLKGITELRQMRTSRIEHHGESVLLMYIKSICWLKKGVLS